VNNTLKPAVDYATKLGLYAIVDLHYISNPYNLVSSVNAFWTKIAPMFASYSNVFYEVFNESSVMDSWATYKPTMQAWVNLIRGFAPKNIIIGGQPGLGPRQWVMRPRIHSPAATSCIQSTCTNNTTTKGSAECYAGE